MSAFHSVEFKWAMLLCNSMCGLNTMFRQLKTSAIIRDY